MCNEEKKWDEYLHIKTIGRDDLCADKYHHPYEPTPYSVLKRLAQSGWIQKNHTVLDYGCGYGRVEFFLANQCGCRCIGVEYDLRIFNHAITNKQLSNNKQVVFELVNAKDFIVPIEIDNIYFFNPFSVEILQSVMYQIFDSYYQKPRRIRLFFYYPSDDYIGYLMSLDSLLFVDEIDCMDLFNGSSLRERIMIFEIYYE